MKPWTEKAKASFWNDAEVKRRAAAYPRLVEALRVILKATRKYPSVPFLQGDEVVDAELTGAARALLRELGEDA